MKTAGKLMTIIGATALVCTLAGCSGNSTGDANPRIDDTTIIPDDYISETEEREILNDYPITWLDAGIPKIEGWEINEATEDIYEASEGVSASANVQLIGDIIDKDVQEKWEAQLIADGWTPGDAGIFTRIDEQVSGSILITDDATDGAGATLIAYTQYTDEPVS